MTRCWGPSVHANAGPKAPWWQHPRSLVGCIRVRFCILALLTPSSAQEFVARVHALGVVRKRVMPFRLGQARGASCISSGARCLEWAEQGGGLGQGCIVMVQMTRSPLGGSMLPQASGSRPKCAPTCS